MVMFTVNYAAGTYMLSDTPQVSKVLTQSAARGRTDYLFTDSTIYNATMFAVQDAAGEWMNTLFYGRTLIKPSGKIAFVPDAQIEGSVHGSSVDAFAVDYVARHGSNEGLRVALFDGDDTLIGNGRGGRMAGEAGDDLIIAGDDLDPGETLLVDGGAGDDVIHVSGAQAGAFCGVSGGTGNDFIFMSDAYISASGREGSDTFFFSGKTPKPASYAAIGDFQSADLVQLDPKTYASLAKGFSEGNFVAGHRAHDRDDYIIYQSDRFGGSLYYDPDGTGGQAKVLLATMTSPAALTWQNIVVSDAIPTAGDPGTAALPSHSDTHAFALHAAVHATGLLP